MWPPEISAGPDIWKLPVLITDTQAAFLEVTYIIHDFKSSIRWKMHPPHLVNERQACATLGKAGTGYKLWLRGKFNERYSPLALTGAVYSAAQLHQQTITSPH